MIKTEETKNYTINSLIAAEIAADPVNALNNRVNELHATKRFLASQVNALSGQSDELREQTFKVIMSAHAKIEHLNKEITMIEAEHFSF